MENKSDSGQSANSSSDFVRKLYKMLEDPSYEQVVRWGNDGNSFVVLENEKFTKNVLPKHFKHSNFASFVRQLNKYDFHKVRHNNEEQPSPYGEGAWEFIHPEFAMGKKDGLDNIKRKAPAPRKTNTQYLEDQFGTQQIDLVNSQLVATQHQLQHLQERYNELQQGHVLLLQQVVQLQKFVKNHDGVMHRVMGFLHSVDAQRRNSRINGSYPNGSAPGMEMFPPDMANDDHPASPLQQASELLGEFSAENLVNKDLEQMTHDFSFRNEYSTPPSDQAGPQAIAPTSAAPGPHMGGYPALQDLDSLVYPVGSTDGIDPINSEHIHNIPYAIPPSGPLSMEPPAGDMAQAKPSIDKRKKSITDPGWGPQKPRILLVEDDKTCARIGCKFLQSFECTVEVAADGLEAVNKINSNVNRFDLVFMDIIMPHLDGVSATVCIREVHRELPIIAMTSNIRTDDIEMYWRYEMNDVLPKPFTKEGMLRVLEKYLGHFKKNAQMGKPGGVQQVAGFAGQSAASGSPLSLQLPHMAGQGIKEDPSPAGKSPSTWQSPGQFATASPQGAANQGSFLPNTAYNLTPTHAHPGFPQNGGSGPPTPGGVRGPPPAPHRRVISEIASGSEEPPDAKRLRIYGQATPSQGQFPH